jgi:cytochrome b subunit of formate dehydrogenase/mono/diheme cytochrome c family protein
MASPKHPSPAEEKFYIRFDKYQRAEHLIFLVAFSILGITGLVQKYSQSLISQSTIRALGGIEGTRQIHHVAAVVLMIVSIYHILAVLYKVFVLRTPWSMAPVIEDFKHLYTDVMYYLGFRKHRAYYGRYTYGEKVEYLAVVWGTIVMAMTGFLMWNPVVTTRLLPGEFVPAAKAAHGGEALLAVLAIIIWHFYHVHIKHFNKSMFTGKISEAEMAEEHPAELAEIKAGKEREIPPDVLRKRRRIFFPIAAVLALVFGVGLVLFVTIETTAIETVPPGESAAAFLPQTPTPVPTIIATVTPTAGADVALDSWDGTYSGLFRNRCSTCHGMTKVGGLSLATYQDALAGGKSGPAIVPGNAEKSQIVLVQREGGHPGQLTDAELQAVIAWIESGAPEK